MTDEFIPQRGYYRKLRVYQIAEIIYDVTYIFTQRFLSKGDRTVDQMVQAARSGKQNIAEGSAAGSTSKETEIKLTNVAKASLQELLIDYEDFIRTRDFELWEKNSPKAVATRRICATKNDSSFFREAVRIRSAETYNRENETCNFPKRNEQNFSFFASFFLLLFRPLKHQLNAD